MRPSRARRPGFTLIELLIAISIFLILATVTLAAVSAFRGGDQVSGSARQVQSYISGARDRAIYTTRTDEGPRARGVRLLVNTDLLDANGDPFACTTLQYVESAGYFPPKAVERVEFEPHEVLFLAGDDPNTAVTEVAELLPPIPAPGGGGGIVPFGDQAGDSDGDGEPDVLEVTAAERAPYGSKPTPLTDAWELTPLNRVFQAGLLGERITDDLYKARVRLPKYANGAGRWYQALIRADAGGDEQAQRLGGIARVFLMSLAPGENPKAYNENADEDGYVFELRTVPLSGENPRPLPNATAIDLRGSARFGGLPNSWLDPGATNVPQAPLDIMFDPAGLVTGPLAAAGLVHLPVVSLEDLDRGTNAAPFVGGAFLPLGYVGTDPDAPVAFDGTTYSGPGKTGEDLIVSVNTQTGTVAVAPVNNQDVRNNFDASNTTPDGLADDPLEFAETGLEAP